MGEDSTDITTVKVSHETWGKLNSRKQPGDSFDDVISRLLDADSDSNRSPTTAN